MSGTQPASFFETHKYKVFAAVIVAVVLICIYLYKKTPAEEKPKEKPKKVSFEDEKPKDSPKKDPAKTEEEQIERDIDEINNSQGD